MKGLIRKERRQLRPATWLLAAVVFLWFLSAGFRQRMFLAPMPDELAPPWVLAGLLGAGVGYFQLTVEDWAGSGAYLWHRGASVRRVLLAKALVGWGAIACAVLLPATLAYLVLASVPEVRPILQPRRLVELAALCSAGFATHALGALHATLPLSRSKQLALLLASLVGFAVITGLPFFVDGGEPDLRVAVFVLTHVAVALFALFVLRARALHGRDPAARIPRAATWGGALLLLAFSGAFVWLALGAAGLFLRSRLLQTYQVVLADQEGPPRTLERTRGGWILTETREFMPWSGNTDIWSIVETLGLPYDWTWLLRDQNWHVGQGWTRLRSSLGWADHHVFSIARRIGSTCSERPGQRRAGMATPSPNPVDTSSRTARSTSFERSVAAASRRPLASSTPGIRRCGSPTSPP